MRNAIAVYECLPDYQPHRVRICSRRIGRARAARSVHAGHDRAGFTHARCTAYPPQVTPQVKALMDALVGQMSRAQLQQALGLSDRKNFSERYLKPALAAGVIEMTLPDTPNSRLQQYRLVAANC